MNFIINTTNLQSGGALQVALSLLEEWEEHCMEDHFHVFLSPQLEALLDPSKFSSRFQFYPFKQNPSASLWTAIRFHKKLNQLASQIRPDAICSIFGPSFWRPKYPHLIGFANGYYLFKHSDYIQQACHNNLLFRIKYEIRRRLLFRKLKTEGDHFWVETATAQQRLAETININPNKISVIGNTYGKGFEQIKPVEKDESKRFRLLYVSAYYQHKNFEILPLVLEQLSAKDIACVLTLSLEQEQFERIFSSHKGSDYVQNLGPIHPKELATIYQNADAILMPSLLETFSANYPEAMKAGIPILCAQLRFAQEICGDAALYFDPKNPIDISEKINILLHDKDLKKQLIFRGKERLGHMETPSSRAEKLIHLLQQLAHHKNGN